MLAFLRQLTERCHAYALRTPPIKPAQTSMNISKEFLEILQLSFEARYMGEDVTLSKKKNKFKEIEDRMDVLHNYVDDVSTNTKFDDIVALATAYYNMGLEYAKSTEKCELAIAITHLITSITLLGIKLQDPKAILISIGVFNELDSVFHKTERKDKHSTHLSLALNLYLDYTNRVDYPDPIHIASLIGIKGGESNPKIILDTFHCRTLHSLGIHYLAKPKHKHEFVKYLHHILNVQLTNIVVKGKCDGQFQEKDIALTLFDLSKYFLANDRFTEAKSYIIAADYVISKCTKMKFQRKEGKVETELCLSGENVNHICAISCIFWGSYGVHLLRFWMDKFLQNKENTSCEIKKLMSELKIKPKDSELIFSHLGKDLESSMTTDENVCFTETCILNLVDAKSVFDKTLTQLDEAKKFFSADTDIESYAKIVLEISNAYKYFAGFEEERNKRIKLHKRRIEYLEDVCKKVQESNTSMVDTELQIYKWIYSEMVISYCTVMNLMLEEIYNNKSCKETLTEVAQYVKLIEKNITFYSNIV